MTDKIEKNEEQHLLRHLHGFYDTKGTVQYYWIMSDSWRRLDFMTLNAQPHPLVVSGALTRV